MIVRGFIRMLDDGPKQEFRLRTTPNSDGAVVFEGQFTRVIRDRLCEAFRHRDEIAVRIEKDRAVEVIE